MYEFELHINIRKMQQILKRGKKIFIFTNVPLLTESLVLNTLFFELLCINE